MMKKRKITGMLSVMMAITFMTTACATDTADVAGTVETATQTITEEVEEGSTTGTESAAIAVEYSKKDLDMAFDLSAACKITFDGTTTTVAGEGLAAEGNIVTITAPGTYVVSGTILDGQIVVDVADEEDVVLVLNGVDMTNTTSAPIYIVNADKTVITLAEGTTNTLTDAETYVYADDAQEEPNATIFSKADLTINGTGTLVVNGNFNHGIFSKDDLKITGGTINVTSVNDAIKGKDYVAVLDANITINSGGDGIQSSNAEDASLGFVLIEAGTFNITAETDGIQAETSVLIKDGDITLTTGGGSANASSTSTAWGTWGGEKGPGETTAATAEVSDSAKGIKAEKVITIEGGVIKVDSSDDSIHSNQDITINGGTIQISSGDDGIHADKALTVNAGDIYIEKCYEGLEGGTITVNDGNLHVGAMDDGINTSGGNDGSSTNGRLGQNNFDSSDGSALAINGGYVFVDADGDGIDANGDIVMTSGTVVVNGPTNNGNGAVDYNGTFTLTGGTLLAAGSTGMAQSISDTSTQSTFSLNLANIAENTLVHIESSTGENILTFKSGKAFGSIIFSSEILTVGETYKVYTGGTSTGTETDGVYEGGTYSGGSELTSFEMTDTLTAIGSTGGGMQPGGGMPGKGH